MNQPLVTIIVPVYKVEKYLRRCLDSIAAQTYTNFEAILVDDGSPDCCGEICDEYASNDTRFRVIHQKNKGLSAARNTGIEACLGDYIMFVDSDDYIESNICEVLLQNAIQNKAQLVVCGFRLVYEENKSGDLICPPDILVSGKEAAIWCLGPKRGVHLVVVWNKLYKRNLFENKTCRVRFPEGLIYEDEFVSYKLFYLAERVAMIKQPLYNYRQRSGSITHQQNKQRLFALEKIILEYFQWAKQVAPDMSDVTEYAGICMFRVMVCEYIKGNYDSSAKLKLKNLSDIILKSTKKFLLNPYADIKQKKYYLLMRMHIFILIQQLEWMMKKK